MLEYEDCGADEPGVCIHGALLADAFRPLLYERALCDRYRLISYHRRGHGGSRRAGGPTSLSEQAKTGELRMTDFLTFAGVDPASRGQ